MIYGFGCISTTEDGIKDINIPPIIPKINSTVREVFFNSTVLVTSPHFLQNVALFAF
jgi:hypothetical protein